MPDIGKMLGYGAWRWYRSTCTIGAKIFQYTSNWHIYLLSISAEHQWYRFVIAISSMAMMSAHYHHWALLCKKILSENFRTNFPSTFCKGASFPSTFCNVDEFSLGPAFLIPQRRNQYQNKVFNKPTIRNHKWLVLAIFRQTERQLFRHFQDLISTSRAGFQLATSLQ